MENNIQLSVCVPCFGRPERTKRLLQAIMKQDMMGWEVFMIGDGCPDFANLMSEGYFLPFVEAAKKNGNILTVNNLPINYGGWGYEIRNRVKDLAQGKYLIYVDNDDLISDNHFSHYLSEIADTDYDFVYYNTHIHCKHYDRISKLENGRIGHSEIIIRTDFLRFAPNHLPQYGHDWFLIENLLRMGAKHKKAESMKTTYYVMGTPETREEGID